MNHLDEYYQKITEPQTMVPGGINISKVNDTYDALAYALAPIRNTMVGNMPQSKDLYTDRVQKRYTIKKVIQNGNATIVFWADKTKTVVRRKNDDVFDLYAAVAQALAKKMYGSTMFFHKQIDKNLIIQNPDLSYIKED